MSSRRSRSRSPRRRSSGGSPLSRSRQHTSISSRMRNRTRSEGGRDWERERNRNRERDRVRDSGGDRERDRERYRDRDRDLDRARGRGRGSGRDRRQPASNRGRYERQSRGVEHVREGKRRADHSPPKEMEVDGAGREAKGGARNVQGDSDVIEKTDGGVLERRRHPGRDWEADSKNHRYGRGPKDAESDEAADRQRLLESLINPQEVPRSGYYFEHDDRDAPPSRQRRLRQSTRRSPPERGGRRRERDTRRRRHSSDGRIWRGDGSKGSGRDRWERRAQDDSGRGRRREEPAASGRWKHDMFEQLEKEEHEGEIEQPTDRANMEESSNDIEGRWAHDKFEEMEASAMDNVVDMDTEV